MRGTMCMSSWLIILFVLVFVIASPFLIFKFLVWVAESLRDLVRGRSTTSDSRGNSPVFRQSGSIDDGGSTDSERVWDDHRNYERAQKLRQDAFQNDLNDLDERKSRRDRELDQEQKWQDDDAAREASRQREEADRHYEQQAEDNRRFHEDQQRARDEDDRRRRDDEDRRRNNSW